jgi:hypothetical protein
MAAMEWTMIAEDRRNRIVTILGEMIRRRIAVRSLREAAAYEWNLSKPESEWTRQAG